MKMRAVTHTILLAAVAVTLLAGCSRERIDWKSAESADTLEAYDHFIERHPDSALATQARTRMSQLVEDRDWQRASNADTAEAYKQFLAQHANGKWAGEARIRIENFTLETNASPLAPPAADADTSGSPPGTPAGSGVARTAQPGEQATPAVPPPAVSQPPGTPSKPAPVASAPTTTPRPVSTSGPATTAAPKPHASAVKSADAMKPPAATAAPKSVAASSAAQTVKNPASANAAADPTGGFGIQLGAFGTKAAALSAWKRLQMSFDSELHGMFAHAVPVQTASGQLFRLQAPAGDEAQARGICAALAKRSQPCVVVLPQAH